MLKRGRVESVCQSAQSHPIRMKRSKATAVSLLVLLFFLFASTLDQNGSQSLSVRPFVCLFALGPNTSLHSRDFYPPIWIFYKEMKIDVQTWLAEAAVAVRLVHANTVNARWRIASCQFFFAVESDKTLNTGAMGAAVVGREARPAVVADEGVASVVAFLAKLAFVSCIMCECANKY